MTLYIRVTVVGILITSIFQLTAANVPSDDLIEELIRIGEQEMYDRAYKNAICTFEEVLQLDKDNCTALGYLTETTLVEGLLESDIDPEKAISSINRSIYYGRRLLHLESEYQRGLYWVSLACIYKANHIRSAEEQKALLRISMNLINKLLLIDKNSSDSWFVYGEWWAFAATIEEVAFNELLLELENGFYMPLKPSKIDRIEYAAVCYEKGIELQAHSTANWYGLMDINLILGNELKAEECYYKVVTSFQAAPLAAYLQNKAIEVWKEQERQRDYEIEELPKIQDLTLGH